MSNFEKVSNTLREQGVFCEGCPFVRAALNAAYYLDTCDPSIAQYSRTDRLGQFEKSIEHENRAEIVHDSQYLAHKLKELAMQQPCQGYIQSTHDYDFEQHLLAQSETESSPSTSCELEARYQHEVVHPKIAKFIQDYLSD